MNMSHAYSDRTPQPKSYLGIGLVVALHLAGIYALSAGLVRPAATPPEIITLKPLPPDIDREPPPPEPLPVVKPTLQDPQRILVPPPDISIAAPQEPSLISTAALPTESAPPTHSGPTTTTAVAPPLTGVTAPPMQAAGAVCSVMPKPDVPAVNWSGDAVLQVMATVRGGRVVGTDVRVAQGALDGKTKRSLQRSVESALAGYQCQGDAVFQQEFAFRLD